MYFFLSFLFVGYGRGRYIDQEREVGNKFSHRSRSRSPPSPTVSSSVTVVSRNNKSDSDKTRAKPRCRDFDGKNSLIFIS